jgi:TonB-dependent starch-binding outer membrane protein SusC
MAFRTSSFKRVPLTLILGSCFFCSYSSNHFVSNDSLDARKASAYLGFAPKDDSASVAYPNRFAKGYNTQLPALIQGQMPGLNIYSTGEPGKPFEVYNRLFTSFSLSSVSFYVVDNMPIYGSIGFLNLDDIASISFVDGGTAASIYGERAANGAIVIKTKAATRSLKVTYSGSAAVSSVAKQVDVYSASEFKKLVKVYAPYRVGDLGTANTNWQDAIYRSPLSHQHSVAISDSRYGIPFRASVGYADQQGVVKTTDYRKLTGAITVSPSFFNDDLKVDAGVWLANEKSSPLMGVSNSIQPNPIENAIFFNPTYPVHEANSYGGYFCFKNSDGTPSMFPQNPVALLEQVDQSNKTSHINESIRAAYRLPFLKALSFSAGLANVSSKTDQSRIVDSNTAWNPYRGASSYNQNMDYSYTSWDLGVSYTQEFEWLSSRIQATAGTSRTSFSSDYSDELRYDLRLMEHNTLTGDSRDKATFATLSYGILGRYQFGLNYRDGKSSFFGKDVDVESYQVNGSWNVKNEPFLVNSNAISRLTVFASAGKTKGGTDLAYSGPISFDIKPSAVTSLRVGAELGLYGGRVAASVAYNRSKVKDVITTVPIVYGTGFTTLLANAGSLKSSSIEMVAQVLLLKSEDLSWHAGINLSYATNEVDEFQGYYNFQPLSMQVLEVGKPIGSFYVNKQAYGANGKPIEGLYENTGDKNYSHAYKQSTPSTLMSFSSQLRYKSWDLALMGRASFGNYVYNDVAINSYYDRIKYYWPIGNVSKLASRANFVTRQSSSDFYVENGSFFRMEYISLGYTFGGKLRPHVSATVQNAFLISGYSGVDPEVSSGIDNAGRYPRPRVFSLGLELSL